jgi:TPP-dependent 2-oxoacid decarboxylase
MGAKTTKFIQEIQDACDEFAPLGVQLKKKFDELSAVREQTAHQLELFNKRVKELEEKYGGKAHAAGSPPELEKAIEGADPVMATIIQVDDRVNAQFTKLVREKKKIVEDLGKLFNPFVAKLDKFEEYVTKKEKSTINPFKKKSVAGAKKFIVRMRKLQVEMKNMQ